MFAPALRPERPRHLGLWLVALLFSLAAHWFWLAPPRVTEPPALAPSRTLQIIQLRPRPLVPELVAPARSRPPRVLTPIAPVTPLPTQALGAPLELVAEPEPPQAESAAAIQFDLPEPQRLRYALRLNGQRGQAELIWSHDGQRYQLRLQRWLAQRELPSWLSEGVLGETGLEPARFEVHRNGRLRQRIQLRPPTQDRLSWLLQLALAAQQSAPGRPLPPVTVELAGWRGGVQRWVFVTVPGQEEEMPAHLRHLRAQHPVDPRFRIEVWLDPNRGFLPLRWRQSFDEELRSDLLLIESEPSNPAAP